MSFYDENLNNLWNAITSTPSESCRRCSGTGQYRHFGQCFACKGTGSVTPKASFEPAKAAATVSLAGITAAFDKAAETKKAPILRLPGLKLSKAKPNSRNPGAIYVARTGADCYLGKIVDGRWMPTRECTAIDTQKLQDAAKDPLAAAVAYGRETGSCACCGRELSDPVSVERGIGPICADKFGW
jgi:hypothetical protein